MPAPSQRPFPLEALRPGPAFIPPPSCPARPQGRWVPWRLPLPGGRAGGWTPRSLPAGAQGALPGLGLLSDLRAGRERVTPVAAPGCPAWLIVVGAALLIIHKRRRRVVRQQGPGGGFLWPHVGPGLPWELKVSRV